jgi:hypothetical protein
MSVKDVPESYCSHPDPSLERGSEHTLTAAMSFNSVSVIGNALRLRWIRL